MSDVPKIDYKPLVNPMLALLPDHTKDPRNYMKIQKALLETLTCGKSHSDPIEMTSCKKCSQNMLERRELMKKFGFVSSEQYMEWRKVQETIRKRMPREMYGKMMKG